MHKPYCVKIELARGCTRRCSFCALSTIDWRDGPWQFIKPDLFKAIVEDLQTWVPKVRIEMDERGEPSFHPRLLELISIARKAMPKAQLGMISNGDMVDKKDIIRYTEWVESLLDAGLNVLVFDCYEEERLEKLKDYIPEARVYDDVSAKEWQTSPWVYQSPKNRREVFLLPGYWFNKVMTRKLRNQGGNLDTVKAAEAGFTMHKTVEEMAHKMCTRPFKEFVIHSDGTVPLCCDDWRQEGVIGKFPDTGLRELWYGNKLNNFRLNLINHDRTKQSPCNKCNTPTGFRAGIERKWFERDLVVLGDKQ